MKNFLFHLFSIHGFVLPWIFLSSLISTEISHHYLGINADLETRTLFFNDKIETNTSGDWKFNLSSNAKNVQVLIGGQLRKKEGNIPATGGLTTYSIPRYFWEEKEALLEVKYQISSDQLSGRNRFNSNELFLISNSGYFPTANEDSAYFDLFLQSPENWEIKTEGKLIAIELMPRARLHKIKTDSKITGLNIFGFPQSKLYIQTANPPINIVNNTDIEYNINELSTLIKVTLNNYKSNFGWLPFNEFSFIIHPIDYFTTSSIAVIDTLYFNTLLRQPSLIDALLFSQWIQPSKENYSENQEAEMSIALMLYLNEYSPRKFKNPVITHQLRKDILSAYTLNQNILINYFPYLKHLFSIVEEYTNYSYERVYNFLFILILMENLFEEKNLSAELRYLFDTQNSKPLNPKDVFTHLAKDLPFESKIFLDEWNKSLNKDIKPKLQLQVSNDRVKLVQQGFVRPLIVPVRYQFKDGTLLDSLISTRSYSITICNPLIDSNLIKVDIDPEFMVFRSLADTEIKPSLSDIELYPSIQIAMKKKLSPLLSTAKSIESLFPDSDIIHTVHNEIDPEIPAIHIGYLPEDFTYLATDTDIILEGRKFYSKSHALVYTYLNSENIPNVILYSKASEEISFIINKLNHFGKYGYIIFRHGNNAIKGQHQTNHSHLIWKRKR